MCTIVRVLRLTTLVGVGVGAFVGALVGAFVGDSVGARD